MFNFASWNIRGLNSGPRRKVVRHLMSHYSLSCIFLLETRVRETKADDVIQSINASWRYQFHHDAAMNGRICVFWDPTMVDIQFMTSSSQRISGTATELRTGIIILSLDYMTCAEGWRSGRKLKIWGAGLQEGFISLLAYYVRREIISKTIK